MLPFTLLASNVLIILNPTETCKRMETVMTKNGISRSDLETTFITRLITDMQLAGHTVAIEKAGGCAYCVFPTRVTDDIPKPPREENAFLRMIQRKAIHKGVDISSLDAKANLNAALMKYDYVVFVTKISYRHKFWAGIFQPGTRQLVMDYEIVTKLGIKIKGKSMRQNMVILKSINKESLQYLLRTAASHLGSAVKD
ncbi:MAG: hypothetical protein EXR21_07190 [Flavobacteriaceae bacterium]|nr:hypothetical protein [Flavobacteriaceae bacterium]